MEKYKRQEVSPVEEENERDESYQATTPNIDSSRTQDNYHIIHPFKSYIEIINSRLAQLELKRKIRSDAILMNSFVVTSDGEFFKIYTLGNNGTFSEIAYSSLRTSTARKI